MTTPLMRRMLATVGTAALGLGLAGSALAASASSPVVATSLSFLSPSAGFVRVVPSAGQGTGQIYATSDGGAHWHQVGLPVEASLFAMGSATLGAALVPLGVGACGAQWTAVTTRDGAYTWHSPTTVAASDGPNALAVAAGRPLLLNGSCAGPYATLLTPGGPKSTWRTLATFQLTKAQAKRYFSPTAVSMAFHGKSGFAAVAYFAPAPTAAPLLLGYTTTDGGSVWHAAAIGARGLRGDVRSLSFANRTDGIAAVENRAGTGLALYATTDGGSHWTRTATVAGSPTQLDLVTAKVGYAAVLGQGPRASSRLLKTSDGGRTWRTVHLPS